MLTKRNYLGGGLTAVLGAIFIWRTLADTPAIPGLIASTLMTLLFGVALWRFGRDLAAAWSGAPDTPLPAVHKTPFFKSPAFRLGLGLVLFRLAVLSIGYAVDGGSFLLWTGSDARHYLNIAINGYAVSGDARFLIVFFPFYPILVRGFAPLAGYLASALFLSNICAVAGAYVLYRLVLLDMDEATARRAAKYFFILPAAFFLSMAMSESLFFLLSVLCIYMLRTDRWLAAGIFGMLAAFTRSLGLVLIVPMVIEGMAYALRQPGGERIARTWKKLSCTLMVLLGLAGYLLLNYIVTGDALRFMTYQKEHWDQSFGFFFETAAYQTKYLLENYPRNALGLWLPNLLYTFGSLAIVIAAQKKLRTSYTGYFLAYFAIAVGVTWLLSGPRYLTCAFTLPAALAALTEDKRADAIATTLCMVGFLLYLGAYITDYPVY